jgi:hypothetical protein
MKADSKGMCLLRIFLETLGVERRVIACESAPSTVDFADSFPSVFQLF